MAIEITTHVLTNDFNNALVAKLIALTGKNVTMKYDVYGTDPEDRGIDGVEFENDVSLMIAGDNSWGAVTEVKMFNGHIILTANFGDYGDLEFCATIPSSGPVKGTIPDLGVVNLLTPEGIALFQTFDKL